MNTAHVLDERPDQDVAWRLMPQNATAMVRSGDEFVFISFNPNDPSDLQAALDEVAALDLAQEMVNKTEKHTGIHNTIFVSPKGHVRHGPRIKVAINPPITFTPHQGNCSVSIETGEYVVGDRMDGKLASQVKRFVELNREVLLDYWNYKIGNDELDARLQRIDSNEPQK